MSLDPSHILQTGLGFWGSKALLSAVELGLFTELGQGPAKAGEIRERLGLHERATHDFLDALVAMKLLERDGRGRDASYKNTPDTAAFLDKNSPAYVGGMLEMANARLFRFWGDLTPALKTGEPQNEIKEGGGHLFDGLYADEARLEQFLRGMAGIQNGNFHLLAEKFDFSQYQSVCDAGGANGALCRALAQRHPHLQCISFDLPPVGPVARREIERAGLSDRIRVVEGDFMEGELPRADVITLGNILHDWGVEEKKALIKNAHSSLNDGGVLIAIENVIDNERRTNTFGLLMSLNMLIETHDGFDYTAADFDGWARDAGFRSTEVMPLAGPSSAVIAYK
jgi:predicted O-methyltransferase YrrM